MKSYDKVFLTGCDATTEWMLPWFIAKYKKHNKTPLVFANFGVSERGMDYVSSFCTSIIDLTNTKEQGWFKKPQALLQASKLAGKVCWIDTDCEILADLSPIFDLSEPTKLAMVEDVPWSKRRSETWHNTGVVLIEGRPVILDQWVKAVSHNPQVGDQEVLHSILRVDLRRQVYVKDLPEEYNWVRLNIVDGRQNKKIKVMHWTGRQGKDYIRKEVVNG